MRAPWSSRNYSDTVDVDEALSTEKGVKGGSMTAWNGFRRGKQSACAEKGQLDGPHSEDWGEDI